MDKDLLKAHIFIYNLLKKGVILGNYGSIYTDKKEVFDSIIQEYAVKENATWKKEKDWSLKDIFLERYKKQKEMVDKYFIPLLNPTQRVGDLACANGEWSMYISEHVKCVEGYEYSENMVKTAKKRAKKQGIRNVTFIQADAKKLSLQKTYDNFMMMGLLTCISNPTDAQSIVKNVACAIKRGGHLITKDTLNTSGKDVLYLFISSTGYQGIYYSQEMYYNFFTNAEFELIKEEILDEVNQDGLTFISRGAIWRKK